MNSGKPRSYYLIAGEASGDLHGGNLIKALKAKEPDAAFRAWGGDYMEAQGATLVRHIRDLAFMGFVEVVANLRTILGLIGEAKKDLKAQMPDALILVDYPGFNLRIAKFANELGIKVYWYISPQVWAWKAARVHKLHKYTEQIMVILPFEEAFYSKYGYKVHFVGHPLLDAVKPAEATNMDSDKKRVALLPGSREQEVSRMLPLMLQTAKDHPQYQFDIAGVPTLGADFYTRWVMPSNCKLTMGETYGLLQSADAAIVTSGTATLETALHGVPEVVGYKGNAISYWIARRLVDVKYISLVNLIADKPLVVELIQKDWNAKRISAELALLLEDEAHRAAILEGYQTLRANLGGPGASARAAELLRGWLG